MEIVGGVKVQVWGPEDEGPHKPGPQEMWQESVVLVWWDLAQGIGGFYRIGHETNWKTGPMVSLWSNTITPEGIFHKSTYLPLREQDKLPNGFGSGDGSVTFEFDKHAVWTIDEPEVRGRLVAKDFHPGLDCYPKKGAISEFAPHHMEGSARVTGELTVKGRTYTVNGLALRDHGWGERQWHTLRSHRWATGVFEDGMSFVALSWYSSDDTLIRFGWVVRGEQVFYAKDVDIVGYVQTDGITTRGGHVKYTLTNGEVLDIEFESVAPTCVSWHHNIACGDTMCRVILGAKVGIGDFELTNNTQGGTHRPKSLESGVIENGWHPAKK
ncbi:MAG TPA: hypothetical protein VJM11_09465 [Nevskiaceae bacterium]|nr:hypothetical protein [Nevskiaceae bacterium]